VSLLARIAERKQRPSHLNLIVLHDINLALRFCTHGLLLLPGGETRHGPLDAVVNRSVLEEIYGCAMVEICTADRRLFIPA
jgi:iron complex transport system ATP-binding protein